MIPSGKILFPLFLFFLLPHYIIAQQFKYTTVLNKVDSTGFYTIPVSPQLTPYLKVDFSDVRIADKNNQWVPHLLQQGNAVLLDNLFTPFPILQNAVNDSGKNLLVIENTKPEGIYNLKLFLKNAAVSRTAKLSGSNNQKQWYIIDDNIIISRSYENIKDEYMQEINFPLAKYQYLKLIIDNVQNNPLFITKAGFYAKPFYSKSAVKQINPPLHFTQMDSSHYSYIEVRQDKDYQFDKVSLGISGTRFYNREVQICLPAYGKNNLLKPGLVLGNYILISATPAVFDIIRTKTSLFFIVIKNGDNPPLKIETIQTELQNVALVTYLQKGQEYSLLFGDSLASFADYDLQTFKDSIINLHTIGHGIVQAVQKKIQTKNTDNKNWWIWPSIIFAGLVLSFLTFRLTADINNAGK